MLGVSDEMLEMENDHLEEEMASRVSLMKSVSLYPNKLNSLVVYFNVILVLARYGPAQ